MADKQLDILLRFITEARDIHGLLDAADDIAAHFAIVEKQIAAVRQQAQQLKQVAEGLNSISQKLVIIGTVTTGGIFAAANKYVKDAKTATEVTEKWKRAQEELNRAGERFGSVAATVALPILEEAAELADKASRFVEKHPDLVKVALNAGLVTATIGAVGTLVSRGIRFYADLQLIGAFFAEKQAADQQAKAAAVMLLASQNQLKAAGAGGVAAAVPTAAKGAGIGAAIASPAGILTLLAATLAANKATSDSLDKIKGALNEMRPGSGTFARYITSAVISALPGGEFLKVVDSFKSIVDIFGRIEQKFSGSGSGSSGGVRGGREPVLETARSSGITQQILDAYADYKADDLALVQAHYRERSGIIADALAAEQAANKQYADNVAQVRANLAKSLAGAASDFNRANERAAVQFQQRQAEIVRDGERDIQKIREESQERLRKLEEDHNDRVEGLTAARDALGLAKENRDYRRAVRDEKRDTNQEVKQRREEIQQRLADLRQSYEQERAERLIEYQQRLAEIRLQAAERLKELAIQHADEIKRIREQKAEKLRELDQQFIEERKRRYQYFVAQIREMDAALLGELNLKQRYHTQMLNDLNNFLASYRAGLGSLGAATAQPVGRAFGGYATYGTYRLGDSPSGGPGGAEFVMSNRTVQAAESLVGGRLTQEGLLNAMMSGGSRTVNYNGRFSGEYTASMKRQVAQDVNRAISQAVKV